MVLLLKNLLFTLLVPGTATVLLPYWILGSPPLAAPAPARGTQWLALLLGALGLAIYARCVWEFGHRGRGTPLPADAPRVLVVQGLYRYVRNPMYLGVLLMLLAEVLYFLSWELALYTAVWFAFVHSFTMLYEKPTLASRFGGSYESYRRAVGRWIPGRPYSGA